jgi:hypothetical protein
LFERSGVHFFVDLQNILIEYSYLQICRLPDRIRPDFRGKRKVA